MKPRETRLAWRKYPRASRRTFSTKRPRRKPRTRTTLEETNEEETEVDETSDVSGGEGAESLTWAQFLYKGARLALPYFYMIFISLALAYSLYLIDSQQKEIHGLQSRIQSIEQACSRKRAETARSIQFGQ